MQCSSVVEPYVSAHRQTKTFGQLLPAVAWNGGDMDPKPGALALVGDQIQMLWVTKKIRIKVELAVYLHAQPLLSGGSCSAN